MSDDFTEPDLNKLNAFFAELDRWASLSITIEEISKDNNLLICDLSNYDPTITIPLLASLLTLPELQSHCIRLEILVALAVVYCRGRKKATVNQIIRWFAQIGKSQCVSGEDPAEDVFVSIVQGSNGDYRLLSGVWEAAGFYTQRVLEVIATMPDTGQFGQIKNSVHALLVISDMVCEKAELRRYQLGSEEHYSVFPPMILPSRSALISRVSIAFAELDERGIKLNDIKPFLFHPQMRTDLPTQEIGLSYLDRCPLIVYSKTHLTVSLPSALSVALRDYVIENIIEGGFTETFDSVLAQNYSKLFFDTPLLGGPMQTLVHWKMSGAHRTSNICLKIDEGYFISFHLFLPSVRTHSAGGFKYVYQDDGALSKAMQDSVNEVLTQLKGHDSFKEGLVVLVGCGWGKGYSIHVSQLDHPHWRLESMSAADIVRLSWPYQIPLLVGSQISWIFSLTTTWIAVFIRRATKQQGVQAGNFRLVPLATG